MCVKLFGIDQVCSVVGKLMYTGQKTDKDGKDRLLEMQLPAATVSLLNQSRWSDFKFQSTNQRLRTKPVCKRVGSLELNVEVARKQPAPLPDNRLKALF